MYFVLQITQLTEKLKNQSESHKQAQENLHEQLQEQKSQLRSAQDRCQSLESNVSDLTAQLTQSKERLAQLDTQVCFHVKLKRNAVINLYTYICNCIS